MAFLMKSAQDSQQYILLTVPVSTLQEASNLSLTFLMITYACRTLQSCEKATTMLQNASTLSIDSFKGLLSLSDSLYKGLANISCHSKQTVLKHQHVSSYNDMPQTEAEMY